MKIANATIYGRKAWELDNDLLRLVITQGGGNVASLTTREEPGINPLWKPVWRTIEPWEYRPEKHGKRYGSKLLATICGHNLCLGWFGDPSEEEAAAGMGCHGEAPVARWKLVRKRVTATSVGLTCDCDLPVAGMRFDRTVTSRRGSHIIRIRERLRNMARRDVPFTMCQHVTVGPPFLEKGVTLFDMPATKGHTFPGEFEKRQRLRSDTPFAWPDGPGAKGEAVDMRLMGRKYRASSDFSTQLMDPKREDAWFSAVNPRLGLLLAYAWRREDFPWVGNWEENYGRKGSPWAGKSLTRGMEFANTPFPNSLRSAVDLGSFHRSPTFRWLPARGCIDMEYSILYMPVPAETQGVADIVPVGRKFGIDLIL